jgi:hypothetical protein
MRRVTLTCTLLLSLTAAGCGDDNTPTTPINPTPVTVTETFTGTLAVSGATSHPFQVTSVIGGEVIATLKSIAPDGGSVVGFQLGTWSSSSSTCQAIISNDRATVPLALIGRATGPNMLCARVYDIGALSGAQDYEVEVTHP